MTYYAGHDVVSFVKPDGTRVACRLRRTSAGHPVLDLAGKEMPTEEFATVLTAVYGCLPTGMLNDQDNEGFQNGSRRSR